MSDTPDDLTVPADLPAELPVLALIRGVLLPGTVNTYNVGRDSSLSALDAADGHVLVVPQHQPTRDPVPADLLPVGVIARVLKDTRRNGHRLVLVQGLARVQVSNVAGPLPHFTARHTRIDESWPDTVPAQALHDAFTEALIETGDLLGEKGRARSLIDTFGGTPRLSDAVASALELDEDVQRELLVTADPMARTERVLSRLHRARDVHEAREAIKSRLQDDNRDRQREMFLRQQLDAIRKELGEGGSDEVGRLRERLDAASLPEEPAEAVQRELDRLERLPDNSPERSGVIDWLTRVADLPWNTHSATDLDFDALEQSLDASHFGLDDVKRQVVEHLSVRKLAGTGRADVLLLVGPPGVGKTSIGQAIAEATGRKLVRVALGGVRDEAELRGHRRTYIGSRPGRILEGFRRAGTADPVVLLDEVDKLGRGVLGDPGAALLEILDPEQNHAFVDHYLEVPFDLSRALFVAPANDMSGLPGPLRDRMEVIEIAGYTPREKRTIARRHLMAKAAEAAGMQQDDLSLTDAALDALIDGWTREAGVRQLQRQLGRLYRSLAVDKARGRLDAPRTLDVGDLSDILKAPRFRAAAHDRPDRPGIATGLAWTPVGGDVLHVEASTLPGSGRLVLTGQLGDVMKESGRAALTYVLSHRETLGIQGDLSEADVHIHVPAGATPKDGPSAGVTMFTALASLLSGRAVRGDTAMTGEATLRGRVLPVGGIKSKVLAAHQHGLTRVVLPRRNEPDLDEVPEDVRSAMQFILVDHMGEALDAALEPTDAVEAGLSAPASDAAGTPAT